MAVLTSCCLPLLARDRELVRWLISAFAVPFLRPMVFLRALELTFSNPDMIFLSMIGKMGAPHRSLGPM